MMENILHRIKESIQSRRFVMTAHAEEEMDNDVLSIYDVERCILTGRIIEKQIDLEDAKYLIEGQSLENEPMVVVAKPGNTGKTVIITVYRL